ncbi:hypothetical protein [Chishuiella sp.]|uniref:hypothetical protein n=1 Tax=Chishuiella sp. TaxID=1969467 RepID=UPI0028AAB5ED|nr:hypothetical protein [Chishuiella sp.]
MEKGDIYKLKEEFCNLYKKDHYIHAFIYWENYHGINGIMLTTSGKVEYNNILMNEEHFEPNFEFKYGKSEEFDKTYIAPLLLFKDVKYNHLKKVGELSDSGIKFIEDIIADLKVITWSNYRKFQNE